LVNSPSAKPPWPVSIGVGFGYSASSLVLTAIFATYAVVLVPSLILFGRLSDRIGRRLVIEIGLASALAGLALFAAAPSTVWLLGARALQRLAVGMIGGAATAALVELDPDGDRRRAALLAGLAQSAGSGLGPIAAGLLAQWAPAPRQPCTSSWSRRRWLRLCSSSAYRSRARVRASDGGSNGLAYPDRPAARSRASRSPPASCGRRWRSSSRSFLRTPKRS
jgi:MFS family permease